MSRRNAAHAVSLFPFLAVLLCAMGALILLLLIMAGQIRETAVAKRAAAKVPVRAVVPPPPAYVPPPTITVLEPAPPAPPDPNVELRQRLAGLAAGRDAVLREVARMRLMTARRRGDARAARERSTAAAFDVAAAEQRLAAWAAELADRDAERQRMLSEVRQAQGTLARARQAAEAAEPKVSIVPYDGRSGTARRPILVECRRGVIRFVPEDITLTAEDVSSFPSDFNPLLAGAAALQTYWQEADGPRSPRPYVLLLVHEDGVAAYYAARALLRPIGNETGYELVTDELALSVPKLDPTAQQVCRAAVIDALERRTEVLAEVANRARREGSVAGDLFGSGDSFDLPDEDPLGGGGPMRLPPPRRPVLGPAIGGGGLSGGGMPGGGISAADVARRAIAESAARGSSGPTQGFAGAARGTIESAPSAPGFAGGGEEPGLLPSGPSEPLVPSESFTPSGTLDSPESPGASESLASRSRRGSGGSRSELGALGDRRLDFQGPPGGKTRWGMSAPTASISLERPMPVVVTAESITVGGQPPILLGDGVTDETVEDVLDAVDREAAAWGRSPGQFYWSPRLRTTVRPGGTAHYDRLRKRLSGTGLAAGDRIELAPPVPAFLELRYAKAEP